MAVLTPLKKFLKEKGLSEKEFTEFLQKENLSPEIVKNIIWFRSLTLSQKLSIVERQKKWIRKARGLALKQGHKQNRLCHRR